MSLGLALAYFRRRQAELFSSECVVTRATGESEFDPDTGEETPADLTSVYTGPCLVRSSAWVGADVQAGQQEVRLRASQVKFPMNTPVERNDVVTITASTYDEGLVGRAFRITDVLPDDWQVARTTMVEEVT